jgi:hypothetical protein
MKLYLMQNNCQHQLLIGIRSLQTMEASATSSLRDHGTCCPKNTTKEADTQEAEDQLM